MKPRFALALVLFVMHVVPLGAQSSAAMDVSSALGTIDAGPWRRDSRIGLTLNAANAFGFLRTDGLVVEQTGRFALPDSRLSFAVAPPAFGVLRFSAAGALARDAWSSGPATTSTDLSTALSARFGSAGMWLGGTFSNSSTLNDNAFVLGAWKVLGTAVLSINTRSETPLRGWRVTSRQIMVLDSVHTDTAGWEKYQTPRTVRDSAAISRLRLLTGLEARVDWSIGRTVFAASMSRTAGPLSLLAGGDSSGGRGPAGPALFGRVDAAIPLRSHVALVVGAGTRPGRELGAMHSRFVMLGLRLSRAVVVREPPPAPVRPVATAFALTRLPEGTYRIVLRVPSARTVELSGDFNGWAPVSLTQMSPDRWEATLALAPGPHRINVRVDGDRWTAPPGVPSVEDEFNGRVGIIVVPDK